MDVTIVLQLLSVVIILLHFAGHADIRKVAYIRSEGCDDTGARGSCGLATITVDGKDYSKRGRGYNVVVLNGDSGK